MPAKNTGSLKSDVWIPKLTIQKSVIQLYKLFFVAVLCSLRLLHMKYHGAVYVGICIYAYLLAQVDVPLRIN